MTTKHFLVWLATPKNLKIYKQLFIVSHQSRPLYFQRQNHTGTTKYLLASSAKKIFQKRNNKILACKFCKKFYQKRNNTKLFTIFRYITHQKNVLNISSIKYAFVKMGDIFHAIIWCIIFIKKSLCMFLMPGKKHLV